MLCYCLEAKTSPFYEDIGDWLPDGKGNIGGFWWSPVKFGGGGPGRTGYAVVTLEEAGPDEGSWRR